MHETSLLFAPTPENDLLFTFVQILMQLTSDVNVPKPAKQVSSDYVADSPSQNPIVDMGGEREEPGEEGSVVSDQQREDELSGLFSGMAVSGEKAPRPSRPTQPVQPVRRVKPSPPSARARKQQQHQQQSAFGDLLGLVRRESEWSYCLLRIMGVTSNSFMKSPS